MMPLLLWGLSQIGFFNQMRQVTGNCGDITGVNAVVPNAVCIGKTLLGGRIRDGGVLCYIPGKQHDVVDLDDTVAVHIPILASRDGLGH